MLPKFCPQTMQYFPPIRLAILSWHHAQAVFNNNAINRNVKFQVGFVCDSRCNLNCDSSCDLNCDSICILWFHFTDFVFVFLETMEMTAALLHSQPPLQLVSCHGPIMHPATPSNQRLANDTYRWQLIFLSVPVTHPLPIIKYYCSNPFLFLCFELHSMHGLNNR